MSKDIKEEVKKQIVDEIDAEIVDELKTELRTEIKEGRKAEIKEEIENDIEGAKVGNHKEQIKEKTLYDENDGLYKLIKDELTMAEAIEVQGKIENMEYGERTGWCRKKDGYNKFSVWQLLVSKKNMSPSEIAAFRSTTDIKVEGEGSTDQINKMYNETKKIKESISGLDRCCDSNKNLISVLIGVMGFLYAIGGAMYLYHILHVDGYVLGVYGLVLVVIAVALLWLRCELRACFKI
jgi:hypothetical protein